MMSIHPIISMKQMSFCILSSFPENSGLKWTNSCVLLAVPVGVVVQVLPVVVQLAVLIELKGMEGV